ncbi:sulfatase-like hydrolase/transferase [Aliivibrio salmonicida]|uniref:sulfatase-like hydrolase/transferase n=1 Tax=Aliivibrio salmonicida TaxID=40269 RepID=UPI003D109F8C
MRSTRKLATCLLASIILSAPSLTSASALSRAISNEKNMQPNIPRPEQDKAANSELASKLKSANKKPNIVWLVVDDLGFGDIGGPWGGGAHIGAATPNIDELAKNGLALTSVYSQPTCTPTRSAMMTGRLPIRTGLIRPILAGDKVTSNPWADEMSIGEALSSVGYYTVLTGKWHTGEDEGMRPVDVGFDEFQGYYASQKELTQQFDERRYPDLVLDKEKAQRFKTVGGKIDMYHAAKGQNEKVIVPTTGIEQFAEADHILADFTMTKIKELTKIDKPFFISHNFMRVHADNHPSKEFKGASASKYPYKDNVVEVDALVGRIIQTIRDAGIEENTFIFFTSDNGPQRDSWPDSGFTPFRGGKASAWEGGVRVPGIAYWKGVIQPRESAELFDMMDLFNTSLHLAGYKKELPSNKYFDGIDQTSFLITDDGKSKREHVYIWAGEDFMALRMREYKMHVKVTNEQSNFMGIDYSVKQNVGLAPWLFNLYIDPKEEMPVGHRLNPWLASMGEEAKMHAATFKEFPPKNIGLSQKIQ